MNPNDTVLQKKDGKAPLLLTNNKNKYTMKKSYDSRLRMYSATYDVLTEHAATFATYPAMLAAYNELGIRVRKLVSLKMQQEADRKGYTRAKKEVRSALATSALKLRGKVAAFAKETGNEVLFGEMNISDSKIIYGKSTTALTLSQSIYEAADAMPAPAKTQYEITPAVMTAMLAIIDEYSVIMSAPRIAAVKRKTQTKEISESVIFCSLYLRDTLDGLMREYDNTTFFTEYTNARRIVEEPTLQARIIGVITAENGDPVEGAKVVLTAGMLTFEDMTDENGHYRLRNLNPELYMFKVTKPGFTEYVIPDVDIYAGEHEKMNVKIKANS